MSTPSGATRGWSWPISTTPMVPGLSNEARAKLEAARPRTVGQAGRLDGMTPAALGILAAYLRREARRKTSSGCIAPELFHVKQRRPRIRWPMRSGAIGVRHRLRSDKAAALALTPVSRETEARLDRYVDLLLEWQAKTNLVAPSTLPNLWTRHIADSLQLLTLAPVGQDLGRSRQRRRLSRRGAGLRAGGDAGRHGPPGRAQRQEGGVPARGDCASPTRPGLCISPTSGILWIESRARRLRHRAGSGSATSTYRLRGTAGETRRESAVSQGSRCRGRIDRSH